MHDLVNVALRTLMCLAFLIWVVRPMLFALSRREPNQLEIEEVVDSAVHSAFRSLGVKNPPPSLPRLGHVASPEPTLEPELAPEPELTSEPELTEPDIPADGAMPVGDLQEPPIDPPEGVAAEASEAEETNPEDALREMRERIKQEQKKAAKPTIPAELLQDANSYEDKLMVVRMMVDQEHARVASVLKRMIKID
jgi:hypothetical protein